MNQVRIVRSDAHNFAVEQLVTVEGKTEGKKDGTTRQEWQEVGYYGHRLDHAAESAIHRGCPVGEVVTPAMVKEAVAGIVAQTKDALGVKA